MTPQPVRSFSSREKPGREKRRERRESGSQVTFLFLFPLLKTRARFRGSRTLVRARYRRLQICQITSRVKGPTARFGDPEEKNGPIAAGRSLLPCSFVPWTSRPPPPLATPRARLVRAPRALAPRRSPLPVSDVGARSARRSHRPCAARSGRLPAAGSRPSGSCRHRRRRRRARPSAGPRVRRTPRAQSSARRAAVRRPGRGRGRPEPTRGVRAGRRGARLPPAERVQAPVPLRRRRGTRRRGGRARRSLGSRERRADPSDAPQVRAVRARRGAGP